MTPRTPFLIDLWKLNTMVKIDETTAEYENKHNAKKYTVIALIITQMTEQINLQPEMSRNVKNTTSNLVQNLFKVVLISAKQSMMAKLNAKTPFATTSPPAAFIHRAQCVDAGEEKCKNVLISENNENSGNNILNQYVQVRNQNLVNLTLTNNLTANVTIIVQILKSWKMNIVILKNAVVNIVNKK